MVFEVQDTIPVTGEVVTITKKEYEELVKDSEFLNALRAQGVDNWDGYGDALSSIWGDDE
jgi:hypothetical protein